MAPVEVRDLSKRFGHVLAVNNLSFDVEAGRVTGFLGPNGAGKSTTLRALLGLVRPSAGTATFGGLRYEELEQPSAKVGAVLEDASFHPGRTARNHLRVLAVTGDHPFERVDAVSTTSASPMPPTAASGATRWACASAWASPPPCSAIPRC